MRGLKFRRTAAAFTAALFIATVAVALPGAASAAPAAPAARPASAGSAAPSAADGPCWGHSCIGKVPTVGSTSQRDCVKGIADPYGGFVDAAYDVVTITTDLGGTVTLRYSPLCAANWARWNGGNVDGDRYWVETSDGNVSSTGDSYTLPNYTTMVDGTLLARVCYWDGTAQVGGCSGWN